MRASRRHPHAIHAIAVINFLLTKEETANCSSSIINWDTELFPDPGTRFIPLLCIGLPLPRFHLFSGPSTGRKSDIEIATAMPASLKKGEMTNSSRAGRRSTHIIHV